MSESIITENAKSVIIGRKKVEDDLYNVIITLFDENNPHLLTEMPKKTFDYECNAVNFLSPIKFKFLTHGNDIVVNDISEISISEERENKEIILNIK